MTSSSVQVRLFTAENAVCVVRLQALERSHALLSPLLRLHKSRRRLCSVATQVSQRASLFRSVHGIPRARFTGFHGVELLHHGVVPVFEYPEGVDTIPGPFTAGSDHVYYYDTTAAEGTFYVNILTIVCCTSLFLHRKAQNQGVRLKPSCVVCSWLISSNNLAACVFLSEVSFLLL